MLVFFQYLNSIKNFDIYLTFFIFKMVIDRTAVAMLYFKHGTDKTIKNA